MGIMCVRCLSSNTKRCNNKTCSKETKIMTKNAKNIAKNVSLESISMKEKTSISIEICPICLDEINNIDGFILTCGHEYHKICINEWLLKASIKKCPYCGVILK